MRFPNVEDEAQMIGRGRMIFFAALLMVSPALPNRLFAADPKAVASPAVAKVSATKRADGLVPLNPNGSVLLDRAGKRLLVKTRLVLRDGTLEMLCCPAQTKEHESILAVDAQAYVIHTGLLALGAAPGSPVQFQ